MAITYTLEPLLSAAEFRAVLVASTLGERRHVPTEPVTVVGDTAGAGDAHLAAYMAARLSGCGRAGAAVYANKAAAVIVNQRGSVPKESARFPPLPARAPDFSPSSRT